MRLKQTIILMSALAAAALISCGKNENVSINEGPVHFTAAIGNQAVATPQSRAAGSAWDAGDKIGVFMLAKGTTTIAEGAENKAHTTADGKGNFTPVTGDEIYYPMDNSAVDFIAYYPYTDGTTLTNHFNVVIPTVQTSATQSAVSLMWAKADNQGQGYKKKEKATVAFSFGHCLAKLRMDCKIDPNVGATTLAGATVTIRNMKTTGDFDLTTSGFLGATNQTANITPRKLETATTGFAATYDAIILPTGYDADQLKVDFLIGTETFTWNVDPITFEAGKEYIYEVLITRTGVTATGTIVPWSPVDMGQMTAE